MTRAKYRDAILTTTGRPVAGATVTVRQPGTSTPITETIYNAAGTVLANPLTVGSTGELELYLDEPKRVDLLISKTGLVSKTVTVDTYDPDDLKELGFVNVRDYGALGDGTDDLAAIHAAIAALPSYGGAVYFPPGEYGISDSITIDRNNVNLHGAGFGYWGYFTNGNNPGAGTEGVGISKIKALSSGFNLIEIRNTEAPGVPERNGIHIHDLYLYGHSKTGFGVYGVDYAGLAYLAAPVFERLFIHNTAGGISTKTDAGMFRHNAIMDCGTEPGIEIRAGYFPEISNNLIADNAGYGILCEDLLTARITGNVLVRVDVGININEGSQYAVSGNTLYQNRSHDIVANAATDSVITGNTCYRLLTFGSAVYVRAVGTASSRWVVRDNVFTQSGAANTSRAVEVEEACTDINVGTNMVKAVSGGSWPTTSDRIVKKVRTAGHVAFSSTSWTTVDTGLDIVLFGTVGDWVRVTACGMWNNEAVFSEMDARSWVSGAAVNSWAFDAAAGAGGGGISSWKSVSGAYTPIAGGIMRKLTADDLVNNTVTLRFQARTTTAATKTLFANAADPFTVTAENLGQG